MKRNPYYSGPPSDHFDGLRFFNPDHPATDRSLGQLLRWRLFDRHARWDVPPPSPSIRPPARRRALAVTLVGHASVLVQMDGMNLLVDPVWSQRASPLRWLGPRRWNAPAVALEALPPVHAVLVTHNHYDHLDLATLARLQQAHAPRVLAPLGNDAVIRRHLPGLQVDTLDWWQATAVGPLRVTLVPALHWSARGWGDRRMALWGGFHLQGDASCYVAGDTAYGNGWPFRQLRARLGAPDLAVLPIGAYAPRWFMRAQHMGADEAVQAMLDCGAGHAVGVHWGTFRLTDESRLEPPGLLVRTLRERGLDPACFAALQAGETWEAAVHGHRQGDPAIA